MHNAKGRKYLPLVSVLCTAILFLSLFSITANSWAFDNCRYYYEALIDVDNDTSTGGPVPVVQGGESPHDIQGIDYIVRAALRPDFNPKQIVGITIGTWNGSDFDFAGDPYTYNLGIMNGYQYNLEQADVVEFFAARAWLGNPQGPMKIVYHASVAYANDYTAPFYYPQSISAVPTLSEWGMIVMSILFSLSAIWMIRKRKAAIGCLIVLAVVLSITGYAWAPPPPLITLDGQVTDWQSAGVSPSLTDSEGDSSINDPGEDIVAGYITSDTNNIYFRIDIVGGSDPDCGG